MKKIFFAFYLFVFGQLVAQQKETVYSITKEVQEISWYEQQQQLWKAEIDKNKTNPEAWYNYFAATRALKNLSNSYYMPNVDVDKKREEYKNKCDQIAEEAMKIIPNTFEANHLNFWNGDLMKESAFLLKAHQISPNDARAFDGLMLYYEVERNRLEQEKFAQKCFNSNLIPAGILNWAYNVLAELEPNAILFTVGDNDTYATWIVQASKQFRKDVTVINTSLFLMDDYRNKLLKELGYSELPIKAFEGGLGLEENKTAIFNHVFSGKNPVYVAATGIETFKEKWGDKLYLTGLAYKYGQEPIDNLSTIKRNVEKRYLLDHLTAVFSYNISDKVVCGFNETYLPAFLKLHKHYQESEEFGKANQLEKYIISISENSGLQSEVQELFEDDKASNSTMLSTLLDVKTIEKNMLQINEKVYVAKFETSNQDYKKFLTNLQRSGKIELYKSAIYDSSGWFNKFKYSFNDPMVENYHHHPAYANYPIVNISYEGAKAYCDWLTQQYNSQRKRKYTQVIFRLPSEQEWKLAAGSGNANAKTPFPNDNILNSNKCYLGNIKVAEGKYFDDGAFHTASIGSYVSNKIGLYNTFGNAAEMIDKKGIAKGGSWYNTFDECTFDKQQTYTSADPGIGFRIVMEIVVK
ncbi:MAG: hypothetical protein FGM14_08700 [Flavobacteriales bacterium]|nr:hypothetical protein [Flavobacteriales bacterium]